MSPGISHKTTCSNPSRKFWVSKTIWRKSFKNWKSTTSILTQSSVCVTSCNALILPRLTWFQVSNSKRFTVNSTSVWIMRISNCCLTIFVSTCRVKRTKINNLVITKRAWQSRSIIVCLRDYPEPIKMASRWRLKRRVKPRVANLRPFSTCNSLIN